MKMKSSDSELDLIRVEKAFHKRIPGFCGPLIAQKTPHGQSNPTYIISSKSGKYVLRRKPDGVLLPSAHAVEREFRVMTALVESELPVPRTHFLCEDPEEIGSVFFVMDYVSGKVFTDPGLPGLSISERASIYDQMNLGLAKLHNLNPEVLGLSDYGKSGNYFERQYSRWSRQYEASATEKYPEMADLQQWLKSNIPEEKSPSCLVHGDWRIDNLIYKNGPFNLAAVIDWEISTLGNSIADLGTQLMQWEMPAGEETRGLGGLNRKSLGIPNNNDYVENYAKRVGITEIPDLTFSVAFSFFRMAAIIQGIKKRVLEGNASNPEWGIKGMNSIQLFVKKALKYIKSND